MYKHIKCYGDFHAHSIYSGHAMSSPSEMVETAIHKGFTYFALTEHVYHYSSRTDNENQNVRPRLTDLYLTGPEIGFHCLGGWEFNNFAESPAIYHQGLRLLGYHSWFGPAPDKLNLDDLLWDYEQRASRMDILAHPERIAILFSSPKEGQAFIEEICRIANTHKCMIEFNTASLRYAKDAAEYERLQRAYLIMFDALAKYPSIQITIGSDAHCSIDIGQNFDGALASLDAQGLLDRVVNIDEGECKKLYELSRMSNEARGENL